MGKAERKIQRNREAQVLEEEVEEENIMDSIQELMRLVGPMLAVGLVVAGSIFLFNKLRASKDSSVQRISSELREANDPLKLVELIEANPDTPEAANQLMRSGKLLYASGRFTQAAAAYDRVVKDYPDYPMVAAAALNIATCLENQGEIEDAKERYEEWVSKHADHFRKPLAELGIGRCLLQASPPQAAEAKKHFESFIEADPEGPFVGVVETYIKDAERLLRKGS